MAPASARVLTQAVRVSSLQMSAAAYDAFCKIVGAIPSLISSVLLLACCFTLSLLASVFFSCCRCFTARFSLLILRLEWFVFILPVAD